MNETAVQQRAATVTLSEALAHAERFRTAGRLSEAQKICQQVLAADPKSAGAEHLLGVIAHQTGKLGEAIEHLRRAVKLSPGIAIYHANLGEMQRLAGRPKLAVEEARRALEIEPKMANALSNLGVALYELKDFEGAARAQREAIAAKGDFAEGHSNLGNALHALRRFDEAVDAYRRALALKPDYADAWSNLGTALHHGGNFDEAVAALRHAVALAPQHANAHTGLGIVLLMRGDLAEGWDEYEWRLRSTERKGPRFPLTPWQGESLAGKHIYVQAEQGFGDAIHFMRYLPLLAARAGQVTVRVHQQLVTLFRDSLPAGITVLGDRGKPAPYQCDTVLLSLPRLFKTRLETIPASVPYLRVQAEAARRWNRRLGKLPGVKVGLVWAGNPQHINDHRRSIDFKFFAPLLNTRGASFVSLQFGPHAADVKTLKKGTIEDLSAEIAGFSEPAAAIQALDLLISIDSSTAHLAGALGKPVWVLLPWVTDWRWMLSREDSPWYPTMRLFRQKRGEAWADVIGSVTKELKDVAQGNSSLLMPFKADGERRAAEAATIIAAEAAQAVAPAASPAATDPGPALILAEQKRRQGLLGDAEELAHQAAKADPDNADAAHLLGIIAHQSGRLDEAIEHLRRAVALRPNAALFQANLGEMCRLAGRIDEAVTAGRRALEINPDYPSALSNLGIALFDQGKYDEALEYYDRAIALQGNFAQAHSNRGNALQRLKRFADAEVCYRRALELHPKFADAWNNLGTCLRELKRPEEAETIYRRALEINPNAPDTLDNLALALKDLDRLDAAIDLVRRALVIDENNERYHLHHGTILLDQHKVDEAAAATERALKLNPNNHDTVNQMGRIAFERGDLEKALVYYRRALKLKPDLADALNNMGNVLKELGRLPEAKDAYLQALRIDSNITGVYVNLADSVTFTRGDEHFAAMETLAAKADGLSKTERMQLDFALGKAYADLKDYDRSFKHLIDGNAAKRATISYDEASTFALFDRIETVFTQDLIKAKSGGGDPSQSPIFVIGMPRSGTTLVEQIISSHPLVHGAGELQTFNDVVLRVRGSDGKPLVYPEFVPALNAAALRQIGTRYIELVRDLAAKSAKPEAKRITDKMPSNYYFAGLIHLTLPNATIIHTLRDPVDTAISCFSKLFTAEQNHTYDLGELGRYYKRYDRLMAHWRKVLPADRILDVHYEDIVADLETQARRIIARCGLPWDKNCLSFHKTNRPVRTASASQVRQPIYTSAIGRWRVYEDQLGPLLSALGISPKAEAKARKA